MVGERLNNLVVRIKEVGAAAIRSAKIPNPVTRPEIEIPNFFETIHEAAKIVFSSKEELQKRPKKP